MAVLIAKAAGGDAKLAGTWEEEGTKTEKVPTAADDCLLNSASGKIEITSAINARSWNMEGYTKELKFTSLSSVLNLGTTTENATKTILKLALGVGGKIGVVNSNAKIVFKSTASVAQKIFAKGTTLPQVKFEGTASKYVLEEEFLMGTEVLTHTRGEINTNGQTVECGLAELSNANSRILKLGASLFKCTEWNMAEVTGLTFEAGTSTVEIIGDAAKEITLRKFASGGRTFNAVTLVGAGSETTGSPTVATLNNNMKQKPTTATLEIKAGSAVVKGITPTTAGGHLWEVKGPGIPAGAVDTTGGSAERTLSQAATETGTITVEMFAPGMVVAQGTEIKITSNFTTNGTASEPTRIASSEPGKAWTITKSSGSISIDNTRIMDSHATVAKWFAGEKSVNASGNEGWKFYAAVAALTANLSAVAEVTSKVKVTAQLKSTAAGSAGLTSSVKEKAALTSTVSGSASLSGSVRESLKLNGTMAGVGSVSGLLHTVFKDGATISATASLSSTVREGIPLSGSMTSAASLTTSLRPIVNLKGSMAGTASLTATLTVKGGSGSGIVIMAVAGLSSTLHAGVRLTGSMAGTASLGTSLHTIFKDGATMAGTASLTMAIREKLAITASVAGTASLSALTRTRARLGVTIDSTASLACEVQVKHEGHVLLVPTINASATLTGIPVVSGGGPGRTKTTYPGRYPPGSSDIGKIHTTYPGVLG